MGSATDQLFRKQSMSAVNASVAPSPSLQDETRANEPSMEEILASIRRIIADDQSLPGNRREREDRRRREAEIDEAAPPIAHDYSSSALEASSADSEDDDERFEEKAPPPPAVAEIRHLRLSRAVEQSPSVEERQSDPVEEGDDHYSASFESEEPPLPEEHRIEEALVSQSTASSVASHFEALAASMILNDEGVLRQYAQEMMRPMLKQWLDDNLPTIVERLVRAEIERVARGGRR